VSDDVNILFHFNIVHQTQMDILYQDVFILPLLYWWLLDRPN